VLDSFNEREEQLNQINPSHNRFVSLSNIDSELQSEVRH
jgi:hypothetical protein